MTEAEWLACDDPRLMLGIVFGGPEPRRKVRLFGCAACRRVWELMTDPRCREAVQASERFADGLISETDLDLLSAAAEEAFEDASTEPEGEESAAAHVASAASYASSPSLHRPVLDIALQAAIEARTTSPTAEWAAQASLLRDIFGNPFRPVAFDPAWRTATATALAAQMYESRDFGAMPILADALQDAGCDHPDILTHCRDQQQPHVRGCWVVDLVLGRG